MENRRRPTPAPRTLLRPPRPPDILKLMDWTHRLAGLFLVTLLPAVAGAAAPKGMVDVREEVLDNGLKVLLLENHRSPAVTFQVWYRVGSRNEVDGKSGIAHFLEHMMFKGTDKVAPEEYARIIQKHGGRSNAFTSYDTTVYHATMSRESIGVAIELEADRMVNTRLQEVHFTPEKKVVQEERRQRTDDRPRAALGEVTRAMTFTVHPYRRPIIGWPQDIERMTLQDLKDFYRTYYAPNNAFIVVAGDFDSEEILARVREHFGAIPRGPEPPEVGQVEPRQQGERRVQLKKEAELPVVVMNYHVPEVGHPDSYALDVLEMILSRGRTSRLHRDLVYEKRVARYAYAGYYRVSIDPTTFTLGAQAMPGKDIAEVEAAIDEVIGRVRDEGVTQAELDKAKNQVAASFIFAQESNRGQAMRVGFYELTGGWRRMNEYLGGIQGVTADDVQRVARKYLDRDRRTVGVLVPQERKRS